MGGLESKMTILKSLDDKAKQTNRKSIINIYNEQIKIYDCDIFLKKYNNFEELEKYELDNILINDSEDIKIICYEIDNNIISYSIIEKLYNDPLNIHLEPYLLSFIHTKDNYKNKGYAKKILKFIKENYEITIICNDSKYNKLFINSGFKKFNNHNNTLLGVKYIIRHP